MDVESAQSDSVTDEKMEEENMDDSVPAAVEDNSDDKGSSEDDSSDDDEDNNEAELTQKASQLEQQVHMHQHITAESYAPRCLNTRPYSSSQVPVSSF